MIGKKCDNCGKWLFSKRFLSRLGVFCSIKCHDEFEDLVRNTFGEIQQQEEKNK